MVVENADVGVSKVGANLLRRWHSLLALATVATSHDDVPVAFVYSFVVAEAAAACLFAFLAARRADSKRGVGT